MKSKLTQKIISLLCLCLLFTTCCGGAAAADAIDLDQSASLQLQYQVGQARAANVGFQIYQVAQVSQSLRFTLSGDFADYAVSLDKLDSDGWRDAAQTLAAYAAADQLTPVQQGVTDQNGKLTFSDLPVGLYLVVGQKHSQNGSTYLPAPFLLCLPNLDETQSWDYHPVVTPKYSQLTSPGDGPSGSDTMEREVVKVWSDGVNTANRPQTVTVQLLRDGEVYDTVTLTAADNWRCHWSDLSANFIWQVVERNVPDGYTVRCALEGSTFVMTNSAFPDGITPTNLDDPNQPSEPATPPEELIDEDEVPKGAPGLPDDGTPDSSVEDDYILIPPVEVPLASLPQTGQLWWPVPLLAVAGLALFLLGWVKQQKGQRSH